MSKTIYHAKFTYRYKYQYFTPKGQSGALYGPYSGYKEAIYIEGEEDRVWGGILKDMGSTKTKRYSFTEKKIEDIKNTGKTNR